MELEKYVLEHGLRSLPFGLSEKYLVAKGWGKLAIGWLHGIDDI